MVGNSCRVLVRNTADPLAHCVCRLDLSIKVPIDALEPTMVTLVDETGGGNARLGSRCLGKFLIIVKL